MDFIDLNKVCPKDHFPIPRLAGGCNNWTSSDELLGCFLGVPLDPLSIT